MNNRQVLGKGLASLFQNNTQDVLLKTPGQNNEKLENSNENSPFLIDIEKIIPNKNQPRKIFKNQEIKELAQSIKENGIIQPIIVMNKGSNYELIAGERRLRASKLAGLKRIPVVFKNITNKEKMIMALLENIQREDLNCVEEALAYYHIIDEYKLTQEEFAKK
jgi:ParB family transcriptional regulator, chromosome partitioning protein